MSAELLSVGDSLHSVWCPDGMVGGEVGRNGVVAIIVDQLPGPMGWYLVARIKREGRDSIIPLHMAAEIAPDA